MMNTKGMTRLMLVLLIVVCNIGCDQVSKKMVRTNVDSNKTVPVIGNYLLLTNVENTGAFLSLGNSLSRPAKNIILAVFPLLALAAALIYILTKKTISTTTIWGLCFIVGGGIGNIFDRIVYGSVTDFLYIQAGIFHTGIFNMADLSIVTGVSIIFLHSIFKKKSGINDEAAELPAT
jgi:signal peptidase II